MEQTLEKVYTRHERHDNSVKFLDQLPFFRWIDLLKLDIDAFMHLV